MKVQLLVLLSGILLLIFSVMGYGLKQKPYSVKPILSDDGFSKDLGETHRKIPKIVYQTFKTKKLTDHLEKVRESNIEKSPSYVFEIWDDDDIQNFIKSNFPHDVYRAYKKINPKFGAARADFWRYCILYKRGGVYMDIKTELKKNLDEVIRASDSAILDVPRVLEDWRDGTYEQWFLAYEPGHPYLAEVIRLLTHRISQSYVPACIETSTPCPKQKILKLTGPDAYTEGIERAIEKYGVKHRTIPFDDFVNYGDDKAKLELYSKTSSLHYSQVQDRLYVW